VAAISAICGTRKPMPALVGFPELTMATSRPVLLLGCFAAADDPFAVAFRHIDLHRQPVAFWAKSREENHRNLRKHAPPKGKIGRGEGRCRDRSLLSGRVAGWALRLSLAGWLDAHPSMRDSILCGFWAAWGAAYARAAPGPLRMARPPRPRQPEVGGAPLLVECDSRRLRPVYDFGGSARFRPESPTAKRAAEKKERDFSQRPPPIVRCWVYDWAYGCPLKDARLSFMTKPGQNHSIYRVERAMSRYAECGSGLI
jgi:hypothetical protein